MKDRRVKIAHGEVAQKALVEAKIANPLTLGFDFRLFREDEEAVTLLLDRISDGYSVRQFCLEMELPQRAHTGITRWLTRLRPGDAWHDEYHNAKSARAHQFAERMIEITDQVEQGTMTPQQGSMCIKSLQWLAERLDGEVWGNRVKVDKTLTLDATQQHLAAVRELAGLVRENKPGIVIDQVSAEGKLDVQVIDEIDADYMGLLD